MNKPVNNYSHKNAYRNRDVSSAKVDKILVYKWIQNNFFFNLSKMKNEEW